MKKTTTATVALLVLTACGRLSKTQAHDLIQMTYGNGDTVSCSWDNPPMRLSSKNPSGFREEDVGGTDFWFGAVTSDEQRKCIDALAAAGLMRETAKGGPPFKYELVGAAVVKEVKYGMEAPALRFPCGKRGLEVTSITTSGNTATVRYTRSITRDAALSRVLAACSIDESPSGVTETMTLTRDDDGKWSAPP
jgi:hypothetical protein